VFESVAIRWKRIEKNSKKKEKTNNELGLSRRASNRISGRD